MKNIIAVIVLCVLFCACGGSKNYLERGDVDRSLQDAVKRLRKKPDDEKALEAIPILYKTIKKKHLDQIDALSKSSSENRWQDLINEYNDLQNAYDVIINSTEAYKLVTPESYAVPLFTMKDSAADYFYQKGLVYLKKRGRENAKLAYQQFNKAQNFVYGYKDASDKKREAIETGTVDIVIKRVQDNSIFSLRGFSYFGNRYSDEFFQQNLTHDLSGDKNIPARFYSEQDARMNDVEADWIIDLNLTRLDMPVPTASNFQRNVSKSIQIGTDTSGAAVYQTANATLLTTRTNYKAIADLEMKLKDLDENKNSIQRIFHEEYVWNTDRVTFQGDRRALSNQDWDLINKYEDRQPKKEEILIQLYKQIYPNLLSQIRKSVSW